MSKVGVEIIKTEETKESGIKYLNINVSNSEVERNPDIVRLCADAGILEYVKQKAGHWIKIQKTQKGCHDCTVITYEYHCSECDRINVSPYKKYCQNCGTRMEGRIEE